MNLLWLLGFKLCWLALIIWQQAVLLPVLLLWLAALGWLNMPARLAVLVVMLAGIALDFALVQLGVFSFSNSSGVPVWMMLLWGCFGCVAVQVFSRWFQPWYLAVLAGAVCGPMAYWAGASLGGQLNYHDLTELCLVLAPIWALLMLAVSHFRYLWSDPDETKLV